jgi:hypothetical protein
VEGGRLGQADSWADWTWAEWTMGQWWASKRALPRGFQPGSRQRVRIFIKNNKIKNKHENFPTFEHVTSYVG